MWHLENQTPFQAERVFIRDREGAEVWVVTIKGTFDIHGSTSVEAARQEPLLMAPRYYGDPETTSLIYDAELIFTSTGTDVLLNGHAYPDGQVRGHFCETVLALGSFFEKRLIVHGPRYWEKSLLGGMSISPPEPFETIPLRYERSFGGCLRDQNNRVIAYEPANPVGMGLAVKAENVLNQPLANIEYPLNRLTHWRQRVAPAGYGPISGSWAPRNLLAGTYDADWQRNRSPLVPTDFDNRFYRCAPTDQQLNRFLRGGEWATLVNLSKHGPLHFKLPSVHFNLKTWLGGQILHHRAFCYRLILEPDVPRLMMIWQTAVPCHGREHLLEKTEIRLKKVIGKGVPF